MINLQVPLLSPEDRCAPLPLSLSICLPCLIIFLHARFLFFVVSFPSLPQGREEEAATVAHANPLTPATRPARTWQLQGPGAVFGQPVPRQTSSGGCSRFAGEGGREKGLPGGKESSAANLYFQLRRCSQVVGSSAGEVAWRATPGSCVGRFLQGWASCFLQTRRGWGVG